MVNNALTLIVIAATLSGCGTMQKYCKTKYPDTVITVEKVLEKKIPVGINVEPTEEFTLPQLPIANLYREQSPDEVIKAYAATVEILKLEVITRDKTIKQYRKKPTE